MKYLFAILFAGIAFGIVSGSHPEAYCINKHKDTDFECIVHCKFKHYNFVDEKYNIRDSHIRNLSNFLIRYNVIAVNKRTDVEKHLKSCVEQSLKKAKKPSCDTIFTYYMCITDEKLVHFDNYDRAIKLYDQTIYVVSRRN
uniref:14.57 kDa salivary PpSP15-like protein n=1 Tax=Phlebotomus sergenti TaxID=85759 RepID=F6K8S6_9DIPT